MKGLVAWATDCIAQVKRAQVQALHGVDDEVGQVALGQPVLQRAGQELLLFGVVGDVACANTSLTFEHYIWLSRNPSAAQTPSILSYRLAAD